MTVDAMIVVIGAGGHAKVVLDAVLSSGIAVWGLVDDDVAFHGTEVLGVPVRGSVDSLDPGVTTVVYGVGDNHARLLLSATIAVPAMTVVHPSAVVSPFAQLSAGVVVLAGAIVQPDAQIQQGVIVNSGAVVEHDCRVGAFSHVAPNATLTGGVRIGEESLIGAGAVLLPGVSIGSRATVGAGAVVTGDVADNATVVGVPARGAGP